LWAVGFSFVSRSFPRCFAWEAFGQNNGVETYAALRKRVQRYRKEAVKGDPEIGCNVLAAPFFFSEDDWIPIPEDWARNIVRGRTYDTNEAAGTRLWNEVATRLAEPAEGRLLIAAEAARYGAEYVTRARLGQGAFRVLVTDAYRRRCAVTGEKTLPVLQAAHIKPFASEGPNRVENGLLLRSDLHTLFDLGYMTVTNDFKVEVSPQIRTKFENGREYYRHQGQSLLFVPESVSERPSKEFLDWHHDKVFVA